MLSMGLKNQLQKLLGQPDLNMTRKTLPQYLLQLIPQFKIPLSKISIAWVSMSLTILVQDQLFSEISMCH